jgi:hypothetical protein
MYEAGLSGSFADHPAINAWSSEKGTNAYCWELTTLESHAGGDSRHQAPTHSPEWNSTIIVKTGVTKGGNGANYDSDLPNH